MSKEDIIKTINSLLSQEFEFEKTRLLPVTNLKNDLGLESLDFVDIAVLLKRTYGIKLKGKDVISIETLGDLYDLVYNRINKQ